MPQQSDEELSEQIQYSNPEFTNLTYRHAIKFKLACKHSQTLNPEQQTELDRRSFFCSHPKLRSVRTPNMIKKTIRITFFNTLLNPSCGTRLPDQRGKVADC